MCVRVYWVCEPVCVSVKMCEERSHAGVRAGCVCELVCECVGVHVRWVWYACWCVCVNIVPSCAGECVMCVLGFGLRACKGSFRSPEGVCVRVGAVRCRCACMMSKFHVSACVSVDGCVKCGAVCKVSARVCVGRYACCT